ncbi:alpha/beta-hydrolase [Diplogelasinospora grovesii]|uniref:Alpha/beta-hydrolase n=1 Tax=Diplogelasinospora grovesii TaxID=303347 RepID=A0AAN6RZD8_9PEZI|nr:alpha/beta-hydrolase [Diplogelasinospora grovesii]
MNARLSSSPGAGVRERFVFQDWLTKPDGEAGWASFFLARGYECYLIDQAFRGRSPWHPATGNYRVFSAETVQHVWTRPEDNLSSSSSWPGAKLHTQWTGSGTMGDAVFDGMYASMAPTLEDAVLQQTATQVSCAKLLDRIGKPAILVGHSQGALIEWLVADVRSHLVRAIVAIEPSGPPFAGMGAAGPRHNATAYGLTNAPLTYHPPIVDPMRDLVPKKVKANSGNLADVLLQADDNPPPRRLVNLTDIPMVVITGEASKHAMYDWGTVAFLKQAGVSRVEHVLLGERGVRGNGHMMMMEKNSDQIAEVVHGWIKQFGGTS